MKVSAIVPSHKPDQRMPSLVKALLDAGFDRVFLVDDGSGAEYAELFEQAAKDPRCILLRHPENLGKGRALKTAMSEFLKRYPEHPGVVTVDADGQHGVGDAVACAEALERHPDSLILGARDFSGPDIPARSAFGNRVTRGVFRQLCGLSVSDTQTGLRAVPTEFCRRLTGVEGERYDFETNMLLEAKKRGVPIREVPVSTIYIDKNAASHFSPIADSLRIYLLIAKFLSASLLSFFCDILIFSLLCRLLSGYPAGPMLFFATAGARAVSSLLNFFLNRNAVFSARGRLAPALGRYYLLCGAVMLASYGGVYLLVTVLRIPPTPAKLATDTLLMLAGFAVQRRWVFPQNPDQEVRHGKLP